MAVALLVALMPSSHEPAPRVWRFGTALDSLTVAGGALWAGQSQRDRLVRIDPATGRSTGRLGVGGTPAAGAGGVWTLDHDGRRVTQIDPGSGRVVRTVALETPDGEPYKGFDAFPAGDALWVTGPRGAFVFDRRILRLRTTVPTAGDGVEPAAWRPAGASVWMVRRDGRIERVDGASGRRTLRAPAVAPGTDHGLATGGGAVVVAGGDGTLAALDPGTGAPRWRLRLADPPAALAVSGDRLVAQLPHPSAPRDQLVELDVRDGARVRTADAPLLGASALAVLGATIYSASPGGQLAAVPAAR